VIKLSVQVSALPIALGTGVVKRVRERFQAEAGTLILDAIRAHLGSSSLYTLSPEYSKAKPKSKKFRRFPGKASDQPIILSGQGIYNALTVIPAGDGFVVQVEDSEGMNKGFDYAEKMEQLTQYLELGLADVENDLDEVLAGIIEQEMLL
jgi:hypothetical protein